MSHKIACWLKDSLVSSIVYTRLLCLCNIQIQGCSQSDEIRKDVL